MDAIKKLSVKLACTAFLGGVFWIAEHYGVLLWVVAYVIVNISYRLK